MGYSRFLFSWAKLYALSLDQVLLSNQALLILSFDASMLNKRYCKVVSPEWANQEVSCLAYPNIISAIHYPDKSDHDVFFTIKKYGTAWTALPIRYAKYFPGIPLALLDEYARS